MKEHIRQLIERTLDLYKKRVYHLLDLAVTTGDLPNEYIPLIKKILNDAS